MKKKLYDYTIIKGGLTTKGIGSFEMLKEILPLEIISLIKLGTLQITVDTGEENYTITKI
jgi:hypothetical protein